MPRQLQISTNKVDIHMCTTAQAFPRLETEPDEAHTIGDTFKIWAGTRR